MHALPAPAGRGRATSYYLYNAHGDVVQLTNAAGTVAKTYEYDAFGNEKTLDPDDLNPFRYCAEYFDTETGSIYLRARYYAPGIGRFLSEDTYRGKPNDPLSLNLYTYCYNNPTFYHDPSGHSAEAVLETVYVNQFTTAVLEALAAGAATVITSAGGVVGAVLLATGTLYVLSFSTIDPADLNADPVPAPAPTMARFKAPAAKNSATEIRPPNLPSWRRVKVDMPHILSGHTSGGGRGDGGKDNFPPGMQEAAILKAIEEAYKHAEKIGELQYSWQDGIEVVRQQFQGPWGDQFIQFWYNFTTKTIETAWPK